MHYKVYLNGYKIGKTKFEKGDFSMGVVFGKLIFDQDAYGYIQLKKYCNKNKIELAFDYPKENLISTKTIGSLCVFNNEGTEIICKGNQITGMDSEGFEILLFGIAYSFYQKEFPNLVANTN